MRIACFIIHLKRSVERMEQVEFIKTQCPMHCVLVDAVDARLLTLNDLSRTKLKQFEPAYPFAITPGEIACFLSHRACWQRIVDENLDAGFIVEDDLGIDVNKFTTAYELALKHFSTDLYIRFPTKNRETAKELVALRDQCKLFVPKVIGLKTTAQIVGIEAARRLLAASESFDRPVDTFLQMSWVHGVNIYTVSPAGVSENDMRLGGSSIQQKVSLLSKFSREFQRFIYRFKIQQLSRSKK